MTNKEIVLTYAKMYDARSDIPAEYEWATVNARKVSLDKNAEYQHVDFYPVGQNASHSFYLGIDDQDNAYYMAYAYDSGLIVPCSCEKEYSYEEEHPCYAISNIKEYIDESVHKLEGSLESKRMYLGHW